MNTRSYGEPRTDGIPIKLPPPQKLLCKQLAQQLPPSTTTPREPV